MLGLQVGQVTERCTSAARAADRDDRSDLSGVVTSADSPNLPTLNRTFANSHHDAGSAAAGNFEPDENCVGHFAMSGGDGRQLDVNVDGGENRTTSSAACAELCLRIDPGVPVQQHRWTAESGRRRRRVNVITKSWHQQLGGRAYDIP